MISNKRLLHRAYICIVFIAIVLHGGQLHAAVITDDENNTISFSKPFTRIISLYPAHTENLAHLGCDQELTGIGLSDDYPLNISNKERFSYRDNIEKFLAASPDLILIRPMISRSQPELIAKLRASGIALVSLQPTSIEGMYSYWQQLGQLCGRENEAQAMIDSFKTSVSEMASRVPADMPSRPRVYFESIHAKMKTFAPDSITAFTLLTAGGINATPDAKARNNSNIAPYGKERLLAKGKLIDIFISQVGRMNRVTLEDIYAEPGFQLIKAVQNKSVFLIEEELVSRPTIRLLEGIFKIHSFLYAQTTHETVVQKQRELTHNTL